jgi:hypothetical protein
MFNLPEGEKRPAIVVRVKEETKRNLQVFIDNRTDHDFAFMMGSVSLGVVFVEDVEHGDKPGQWQWPERE